MKITKQTILNSFSAMALAGALLGSGTVAAEENQTAPVAESDGAEILTRGPIHEAFAGTVSFNPEPGLIVDKQPPALIEEVPPEQRLEGDNVTWIPGYWAWDEDQGDFLWVSGIWRNLPPGRQWVPGYWADADGRHQWTSGYWEDQTTTEVSYLPEPPKSVESGPNIKAPSNNDNWIPGNWIWRNEHYAWRTGYWAPVRENWSWTPAYYRWTHRGYVYVDGFWDYPVVRRGVVFAPIHFVGGYAYRPGYFYTPATVISISVFVNHLFLRPGYGHYYFGDYYEPRYRDRGFYASYSYNAGRRGCDPIFAHYRWENRNVVNWERGRRDYYEFRRDHVESRPPRTWVALNSRPQGDRERGDFGVADHFDRVVGNHGEGQQRFQAVDKQEQARFVTQRQEIRKFGQEREQLESRGNKPAASNGKNHPVITSEKINRSPVMAKNSDRFDKDGGPPARLQARASEKDEPVGKVGKSGTSSQKKDENLDKPKRKNADGSPSSDQVPSTPEHRVKPGQKRDPEPTPEHRVKPDQKPDPVPTPEHKQKPDRKKQSDPSTEPGVKPKVNPNPVKKPESDPNPVHKVKPDHNSDTPPPAHKTTKEQNPQGETRRAEKKPEVKVKPQERPRQSTPEAPQQTRPKKNPAQQVPSGGTQQARPKQNPGQPANGVPDGDKKKRLKKDLTE